MSFNRELVIGIVIGVVVYWAWMQYQARSAAGKGGS